MQIHSSDNVKIGLDGQKYAIYNINKGENIIKYGFPIGHAITDINKGDKVCPDNLKSNLKGTDNWEYIPYVEPEIDLNSGPFMGYQRNNGDVGIRNDIFIIPTVG